MTDDATALYVEIGRRVREKRIERGLSQSELAKPVGLLRTSVVNLEAGRQRVPLHVLFLIARELRCSVFEIIPESFAAARFRLPVTGPEVWV